jgi:hypothetical protein
MKAFYIALLALPFVLGNFTYDKRSLGDYHKVIFKSNATIAIQYEVLIEPLMTCYRSASISSNTH